MKAVDVYRGEPEASSSNGKDPTVGGVYQLLEQHIQRSEERHLWLSNHVLEARAMISRATFPSRLPLWLIAMALYAIAGSLLAMVFRG